MLAKFIDRILSLAPSETKIFNGVTYTSGDFKPILPPAPAPVVVCTLQSILDIDQQIDRDLIIHVASANSVHLIGDLDEVSGQRFHYASANYPPIQHKWNQFCSLEDYIIYIMTAFVQDEETARMLRIVGNIADANIKTNKDDGVTQTVTVKTGVARLENVDVSNPFTLRPYRTFHEIEQPASKFILRMRSSQAGIFIADSAWQFEAITSIRDWFLAHGVTNLIA